MGLIPHPSIPNAYTHATKFVQNALPNATRALQNFGYREAYDYKVANDAFRAKRKAAGLRETDGA